MYILAKTTSRETINKLLEEGVMLEPIYYRLSRNRLVDSMPYRLEEGIIRWGTTTQIRGVGFEYNNRQAVRLASNKKKCRLFLREKGIPIPDPIDINIHGTFYTEKFPMVVRPIFHQGGRKFVYLENWWDYCNKLERIQEWGCEVYASSYYPKTTEWRVHVGSGKVLSVQKKVNTLNSTSRNWNHSSGYAFETVPWKQYRKDIVSLAVDTVEVLGLDFGAVDLLADPTIEGLPSVVVCEVNTAPKLEGYTVNRYAEYLNWLVITQETRHFEVPSGTRGRHYAFKHRELKDLDYDFLFKE